MMGIGDAMMFPATLSLLTNSFTAWHERAAAIGLWGANTARIPAEGHRDPGFLHSFSGACLVAGAVAAVGALVAIFLLPARHWNSP